MRPRSRYFLMAATLGCLGLLAAWIPAFAHEAVTENDHRPEEVFTPEIAGPILDTAKIDFGKEWSRLEPIQALTLDAIPLQADLTQANVDWNLMRELNESAQKTWEAFLACARGDETQARQLYLRPEDCIEGAARLKPLRDSLSSYLATSALQGLSYEKIFSIQYWDGSARALVAEKLKALSTDSQELDFCAPNLTHLECNIDRFTPSFFPVTVSYAKLREILATPHLPPFHPLLAQLLLEEASSGYPFAFGGYDCEFGFLCAIPRLHLPRKQVQWAPVLPWISGPGFTEKRKQAEAFGELFQTGTLTGENAEYLTDPDFMRFRTSFAALKVLQLMTLGQRSCGEFGLWPKATSTLLVAMLSAYQMSAPSYDYSIDFLAMQLYKKMADHCTPYSPALAWNRAFYKTGTGADFAWEMLAEAGAWRYLSER